MSRIRNKGNILKLNDYINSHEVRPHPFYEFFWTDMQNPPEIDANIISRCCRRRPITFEEQGKKRIVISNCLCYLHACIAIDRGYNDIQIWIQEVKKATEEDIFIGIFLDSFCMCPFLKLKPLFRVQVLERAFAKKDYLKTTFNIRSFAAFCKTFGISPAMLTRNKQLDSAERTRLAQGEYKGRGKSIQKQPESKETRQQDHMPQSSERPSKKNEPEKNDVKKQQALF